MNNFWKDLFRTIGHSKGRFLAIAGICALGVGFFGGLQMTCGSMKQSVSNFYNDTNMMDIRIVCSLGISDENVESFKQVDGVDGVMPACETDVLVNFGYDQTAVRVHSLPDNLDTNNRDYINQLILTEGTWPQNSSECILSADAVLASPPKLGDEIDILECSTGLEDTLSIKKMKVVGFARSSYYVSNVQMGQSNLGKGTVNQFAYVPESAFNDEYPYSEVFITVKDSEKYVTGTDEYQEKIDEVMDQILDKVPGVAERRTADLKSDALSKIDDAQKTIDDSESLLNEKYSEFNSYKSSIIGMLDDAINVANNTIASAQSLKSQSSSNLAKLNESNSQVNNFSTVMQGLANIISETNRAIQINNSLMSLVNIPSIQSQIEELNIACNYLLEVSRNFYEALEISYTEDTYNYFIGTYNEVFSSTSYALSFRGSICDSIISSCQSILAEQLYPQRTSAIDKFNEQELALIEGNLELKEAIDKLAISRNDVNNLEAKMYVMDRTKNMGAINFNNDSERMASIANVFPLIFLFVALLVALTSMTRMIEEERITIGTYKALGFSKLRISNKYILYGVISSFIGSVVGLLILTQFLPYVIMFAYSIIYKLPIELPMPFNWTIGILSTLAGVILTIIATLMAATKSLSLVPARLMIPIAPKAGKRILLEHVKPIWNVLTFNWKITFRNMFLYKKRLFMTLIGIAGCTALLLTGFGLHDSISDIMNQQFDEIALDNFKVTFTSEANQAQEDNIRNEIAIADPSSSCTLIHEESVVATPEGHPNAPTIIAVPKDRDQFQQMRLLQNRITKEKFVLDDEGVYVSEKLASLMGVGVGDNITVYNQDLIGNAGDEEYNFKIAGIVENYIAHYIYMTPNVYKQYFNKECVFNNLIAKTSVSADDEQNVIDHAKSSDIVKTAFFTTSTRNTFNIMLRSVNLVVVVLIVSAGLLAFVVLYNLININICERSREIATLKVLGTNRHEINMYIHRETFMLSFFGSILGLLLGIFMEQFVITSAEVDMVMFGRTIYWWSFIISLGITLVFTIIVVLFMRKKLFSISMVESLKSVE